MSTREASRASRHLRRAQELLGFGTGPVDIPYKKQRQLTEQHLKFDAKLKESEARARRQRVIHTSNEFGTVSLSDQSNLQLKNILNHLNWENIKNTKPAQHSLNFNMGSEEQSILDVIQEKGSASLDYISIKCKKPTHELQGILLGMEMDSLIIARPGNLYTRK